MGGVFASQETRLGKTASGHFSSIQLYTSSTVCTALSTQCCLHSVVCAAPYAQCWLHSTICAMPSAQCRVLSAQCHLHNAVCAPLPVHVWDRAAQKEVSRLSADAG